MALLLLGAVGCKSQYNALQNSTDVNVKYNGAMKYFNAGKYKKAADLFESLVVYVSGLPMEDTVQYYWGLSNYKYKDFVTAEGNFSRFLSTFPQSPFADKARFYRLDCLFRQTDRYELDQTPTYKCTAEIKQYLTEYPNSEYRGDCMAMLKEMANRLDKKAFENAKLYYRMEDYLASRVAFKNILKDNSDNIYREDILFYIAMSSFKYAQLSVPAKQKERYLTFIDDYLNFVGEVSQSPYRKELDVAYAKAQKALGRYTGSDELVNAKEKTFERERNTALKLDEKARKAEEKAAYQKEKEKRKAERAVKKEAAKQLRQEAKQERQAAKKAEAEAKAAEGSASTKSN